MALFALRPAAAHTVRFEGGSCWGCVAERGVVLDETNGCGMSLHMYAVELKLDDSDGRASDRNVG